MSTYSGGINQTNAKFQLTPSSGSPDVVIKECGLDEICDIEILGFHPNNDGGVNKGFTFEVQNYDTVNNTWYGTAGYSGASADAGGSLFNLVSSTYNTLGVFALYSSGSIAPSAIPVLSPLNRNTGSNGFWHTIRIVSGQRAVAKYFGTGGSGNIIGTVITYSSNF